MVKKEDILLHRLRKKLEQYPFLEAQKMAQDYRITNYSLIPQIQHKSFFNEEEVREILESERSVIFFLQRKKAQKLPDHLSILGYTPTEI